MDQVAALPGNLLEFGIFGALAALAGYAAYLLFQNGVRNGFSPWGIGAGVVSVGASITAGVFAVIAFAAMIAGLVVVAALGFVAWAAFSR